MLKKTFLVILIGLLFNFVCPTNVWANPKSDAKFAAKVRSEITKLGTGTNARIKVKLLDGTKLKGYVSEVNEDSFTVLNDKTNTTTQILYSQAKQVKGKNNLTGTVIGVAIVIALIVGLFVLTLAKEDG